MAGEDVIKWLKHIVEAAAKDHFGVKPESVIIKSSKASTLGHNVRALVKKAGQQHEVMLNVTHDGNYHNIRNIRVVN